MAVRRQKRRRRCGRLLVGGHTLAERPSHLGQHYRIPWQTWPPDAVESIAARLARQAALFILGTLILFVADRLRLLGSLERLAEPVVTGILGLPRETAAAFVIGFLRRDFGAAGLFELARQGRLDPVQIVVSMVTITLFIPCIANFFMIVRERGWKTAAAIAAFVTPAALGAGALVRWTLTTLQVPLR